MKLAKIERIMIGALVVFALLFAVSLVSCNRLINREFGDCVGLKDAVSKVWEGSECTPESQDNTGDN